MKKFIFIFILFLDSLIYCKNLIPYSGFETGIYRLWQSNYQDGRLIDESCLDRKVFHDGTYSLCLTMWEGSYFYTRCGINATSVFSVEIPEKSFYTLSAYVKSDKKIEFFISCGKISIKDIVLPDEGWKRVYATGYLENREEKITISASSSEYNPEQLNAGHLWIDSLQLEKGEKPTDYEPYGPEVGLICEKISNIFWNTEKVEIILRGVNPKEEDITLKIKTFLFDCFGKEYNLNFGNETFLLKKKSISEKRFYFPSNRLGVYRFQVYLEGKYFKDGLRLEIPFYVVLKPKPKGWNPFGLYLQITVPAMERASRLGLYWTNLLSASGMITEWKKIYNEKIGYMFKEYIPRLKVGKERYNLRYIGNISNSNFVEEFPKFAESNIEIKNETIKFETKGGIRYLKKKEYSNYLKEMAKNYSPYIKWYQIIDEVPFSGRPYMELMVEASKAFKSIDPEIKVIATYPENMAYTYVRAGKEFIDGLYDLGRDLRRIRYAVKAAEIANKEFPIFFYDCAIPFNYLSSTFNGWGKIACHKKEKIEGEEMNEILEDFKKRFNDILQRNIRAVGGGGKHTKGVILYHARIPGGEYQSAFDLWGHPCPSLIAFSIFNSITADGYSLGELEIKNAESFLFSLNQKEFLIVFKPEKSIYDEVEIPDDLNLTQLDIWTNNITILKNNKKYISFNQPSYIYLIVPVEELDRTKEFLLKIISERSI